MPEVVLKSIPSRVERDDDVTQLEHKIEEARKRDSSNIRRALSGCKCNECQAIRYFYPHLSEVRLEEKNTWFWFGGRS